MSSFWHWLRHEFSPRPPGHSGRPSGLGVPPSPNREGFPNGYLAHAEGTGPPPIFDPALKHYPRAFRRGDPAFSDPDAARRWRLARDGVMHHVLRVATDPPRDAQLVLRGSLLLHAWLGPAARQPGDLDFVVRPSTMAANAEAAQAILDGITSALAEQPEAGAARIDAGQIATDAIWTYERAEGRRLVVPWRAGDGPPGAVQVDLVFGEELLDEPVWTVVPHPIEGDTSVWAASPALSLAWKILWLETDTYPQGKDLYDATLLAERTPLPADLLMWVLTAADWPVRQLEPDLPMRWDVDWANFRLECPWVEGEATDWQARLTRALIPSLAGSTDESGQAW